MRLINLFSVQDLGPISCIVDTGPYWTHACKTVKIGYACTAGSTWRS